MSNLSCTLLRHYINSRITECSLSFTLNSAVLTVDSMEGIVVWDHSNESCWEILSCHTAYSCNAVLGDFPMSSYFLFTIVCSENSRILYFFGAVARLTGTFSPRSHFAYYFAWYSDHKQPWRHGNVNENIIKGIIYSTHLNFVIWEKGTGYDFVGTSFNVTNSSISISTWCAMFARRMHVDVLPKRLNEMKFGLLTLLLCVE